MKTFYFALFFLSTISITLAQWSWQNPLPQGNSLRDVKFVSQTVGYAVGDFGTILKTTDGGTNWIFQSCGTTESVSAVTFTDSNNGSVLTYNKIYRTTDGGTNWIQQFIVATNQGLSSVYFVDSNTGWVVGQSHTDDNREGLILRTTDGGTNWTEQTSGTTQNLVGVYFVDTNTGWAVGNNGTILKTTNGGTNWIQQFFVAYISLRSVYFVDSNTGWVVGITGSILRTTNGGTDWIQQTSGTTRDLKDVYFVDSNQGWAVGSYGTILSTTNGGTDWTQQISGIIVNLGLYTLYGVSFTDANTGMAVGYGGIIVKTTNAGLTWNFQSSEPINSLMDIFFVDENHGWAVGGGWNGVYIECTILCTTNGGTNWTPQTNVTSSNSGGVSFTDANTGWIVSSGGTILRKTNAVTNLTQQTELPESALWGVFFTDVNTGWIVGSGGTILSTTNGGTNWTEQTSGTTGNLSGVYFVDSNTGWAVGGEGFQFGGTGGKILKTTNGGTAWTLQSFETVEWFNKVSFADINTGWVVGQVGKIFKTTNGGANWTPQSSGTTNGLLSVDFVNTNIGWAVGQSGYILKTTNGGGAWITNILYEFSGFLDLSFVDVNNGWVVSVNGEILRTTNGGIDWILQSSQTTNGLYGIQFINSNTGWVVGVYGTILKYSSGSLSLNSPNGGENWQVGSSQNITWTSSYVTNVKIEYTTNNGTSWIDIIGSTPASTGSYSWSIPNSPSTQCKVRISDASDLSITAMNNAVFIISDSTSYWTSQISGTSLSLYGLYFIDVNNGWVVGNEGTILRTTNSGTTWIQQLSGTTTYFDDVFFIDANNGWVVGSTILKTTNGGTNWLGQTSGEQLYGVSFIDLNNGWVVGNMGTIKRTTNGGSTWTQQSSGTGLYLWGVSFTDTNNGWVVGSSGTILRTTNGGTTWASQQSGTTNILSSVCFTDSNTGTISGSYGIVLRTTDGGATWMHKSSGHTNGTIAEVFFTDANNGTFVAGINNTLDGVIFRTTDGGTNWTLQTVTTNFLYSVFLINANTGWAVGLNGTILKTTTGGIAPTTPLLPTNLLAIADTFSMELNWIDNSDNETGFVIERKDGDSTNANPFTAVDTVAVNETTFINTGLTPNTTYTYRVFAFNNVGSSGYSNLAQTTTTSLPATFQFTLSVFDGWNVVSVPGLHPTNQNVTTWWSGKDPSAGVFKFNDGYLQVTAATPGQGYWMKHIGDKTYNTGDEWPANGILTISHDALNRTAGWSLIGGYEYNAAVSGITTTPAGLQDSPVFGYANGYQIVNFLIPGYGYWIKLSGAGSINLPSAFAKVTSTLADYIKNDWGKIIITDATEKQYTLYAVNDGVNLKNYELPPAPPVEMFDVRYGSGRLAENISSGNQSIEMQGVEYPIKVRVENVDIRLQDASGSGLNERLKSGEEVTISNSSINKLMVSGDVIPDKYALEQNYPNPFNPSTKIEFSIPEDVNNVTLTIFNALGQRVAELVNSKLEAGKYSYVWNASDVATGLYIYELRTDKFVSVKKMILLK